MPNTLTSIFVSNPATEPVEAPHPNTGVYVTGTQATAGGPWTVVHTLITKTTSPLTMVGRLKNFPAVTVSVVASGGPNAGNIFNNVLPTPTGYGATGTSSGTISVTVSSVVNLPGYRLLAADAAAGPFTQLYQGTTASYPHTGLTANQTKWYKWQYVGGGFYDDSPLSAAFSGVTLGQTSSTSGTYTLSASGILNDADLSMHPAFYGTNQTAKVQAILDQIEAAALTTVTYIINDVAFSCDALYFGSNVDWQNLANCGIVQRPNINGSLLYNKNPIFARGTAPNVQNKNVRIHGGILNGAGRDANNVKLRPLVNGSTATNSLYQWRGVDNFVLDSCEVRNVRSIFGIAANCKNTFVRAVVYNQSPLVVAGELMLDGPKFIGPFDNCGVQNCTINNKQDDVSSLQAVDGFWPVAGHFNGVADATDIYACYGPVSNAFFTGNTSGGGPAGMHGLRVMDAGQGITGLTISNNTGTFGEYFATLDHYVSSQIFRDTAKPATSNITNLTMEGNTVTVVKNTAASNYIGPQAASAGLTGILGVGVYIEDTVTNFIFRANTFNGCNTTDTPAVAESGTINTIAANTIVVTGVTPAINACKFTGTLTGQTGDLFPTPPPATGTPPVGYTGALVGNFIEDELVDTTKLKFVGTWSTAAATTARGGSIHYVQAGAGGGTSGEVHLFGFGKSFALWDTTDTVYRGRVNILVGLDGAVPTAITPQPTQALNNPNGTTNSWAWFTYPALAAAHSFEIVLQRDTTDPASYTGFDGFVMS